MARLAEERIEVRGTPRSVRGFVAVPHAEMEMPRDVVLDDLPSQAEASIVQAIPRGNHTEVRFALPPTTPPGNYHGTLRLGERQLKVIARVEARTHLVCNPARLELVYGRNRRVRETLTVINDGNVAVTIEKHYGFGLFELSGLDRAIGKGFAAEATDGRSPLDAIALAAAEEYGGVVTASVAEGAGTLEPGEARRISFAFRFSERARRGSEYFGYLSIANVTMPMRVHISNRDATEAAS